MALEITPLDAPLGAIVRGWNPKAELSSADLGIIRQAIRDYLVLVFRGHATPTDAELVRFAGRFGVLVKRSEHFGDKDPVAEILWVSNLVDDDGAAKGVGKSEVLEWHADYSFAPVIAKESFLEAVELPINDSPPTSFCSSYAAIERLPRELLERLRPLTAIHNVKRYASNTDAGDQDRMGRNEIFRPDIPETEHPVIIRHPDSGREILYVNESNTEFITGMPRDESDALLKQLFAHITRPEYVYSHHWLTGDFVVFDTLGTQHRRSGWNPAERRAMRQLSTMWTPPAREATAAVE